MQKAKKLHILVNDEPQSINFTCGWTHIVVYAVLLIVEYEIDLTRLERKKYSHTLGEGDTTWAI